MNESDDGSLGLLNLAGKSPLIIHAHDLDLVDDPSNRERLLELLLLSRDLGDAHLKDVLAQAERELLGGAADRVPQDASLDLLPNLEVGLGIEAVQVEEVDGAVKVAEEFDVETRGEDGGDESGDEGGGEDGTDGGGGGEL